MDAMERVEIALRSRLAYYHTQAGTPFAYADASYFPHWYKYPDILVNSTKHPFATEQTCLERKP